MREKRIVECLALKHYGYIVDHTKLQYDKRGFLVPVLKNMTSTKGVDWHTGCVYCPVDEKLAIESDLLKNGLLIYVRRNKQLED